MKKTLGQICQELLHPDPVEGIHFLNKASRLMRGQTMIPLDLTAHLKLATEAKERAEKACPGPWSSEDGTVYREGKYREIIARFWRNINSYWGTAQELNDAHFTAHARTDVPNLADAVIQLVKEVERLKEENIAVRIREAGA